MELKYPHFPFSISASNVRFNKFRFLQMNNKINRLNRIIIPKLNTLVIKHGHILRLTVANLIVQGIISKVVNLVSDKRLNLLSDLIEMPRVKE